jgi:hypothetical protein
VTQLSVWKIQTWPKKRLQLQKKCCSELTHKSEFPLLLYIRTGYKGQCLRSPGMNRNHLYTLLKFLRSYFPASTVAIGEYYSWYWKKYLVFWSSCTTSLNLSRPVSPPPIFPYHSPPRIPISNQNCLKDFDCQKRSKWTAVHERVFLRECNIKYNLYYFFSLGGTRTYIVLVTW